MSEYQTEKKDILESKRKNVGRRIYPFGAVVGLKLKLNKNKWI